MIYNVGNTAEIGKPVQVFDANGFEIKDCIEVDTETGRVVTHVRDDEGCLVINRDRTALVTETRFEAAPLLVKALKVDRGYSVWSMPVTVSMEWIGRHPAVTLPKRVPFPDLRDFEPHRGPEIRRGPYPGPEKKYLEEH